MSEGSPRQGETESTVTDRWGGTGMKVLNGEGREEGNKKGNTGRYR